MQIVFKDGTRVNRAVTRITIFMGQDLAGLLSIAKKTAAARH